ncbi:MAG TPA: YciI family protein, partial [Candidatus Baltobacteraceae bacterium]
FIVILKATADSEAGVLPSAETLQTVGKFNEEMAAAGVLLAGEGLQASSSGVRISYSANVTPLVTEGPFPVTQGLAAGFWIIKVASKEAAIAWASRAPFPEGEVEIRRILEADDFGEDFTPEMRKREAQLRKVVDAGDGYSSKRSMWARPQWTTLWSSGTSVRPYSVNE